MKSALGVLLLFVTFTATAQLAESIEVRITNVDVVVTDAAGRPVPGLTEADFEVFEGGDRQAITNFYEIRADAAVLPGESTGREADAIVASPPEVSQRRIIVFFDNHSIHPFARNKAIDSLEKTLDVLMRPGDEAMVAFWDRRLRIAVPFTNDRELLIAGLRAETKKAAAAQTLQASRAKVIEQAAQAVRDTQLGRRRKGRDQAMQEALFQARIFAEELRAIELALVEDLKRATATLAGLEGKKALIFLGAEMAENPALELFHQIHGMFGAVSGPALPPEFTESGRSISREIRSIALEANANNVTMYMIDTADRDAAGDPSVHMPAPLARAAEATNTPLAMAMVASLTGGLSVPGGEGFEAALQTIATDLSSYYSLGYRSPEGKGTRRIEVKVKRPGLRVRSRASYVARDGDEDVQDRVIANVFHDRLKSDFPVSVEAGTPVRESRDRYRVPVTVTLPSTLTFIPQDDSLTGEFAVYIATGTTDGELSTVSKAVQPMKFPRDAATAIAAQKTFTYTATLVVRAGEQIVSVGVSDTLAGTSGFAQTTIVAR